VECRGAPGLNEPLKPHAQRIMTGAALECSRAGSQQEAVDSAIRLWEETVFTAKFSAVPYGRARRRPANSRNETPRHGDASLLRHPVCVRV